ncbi:hypothetical protein WKV44_03250 [Spirochaetia bacterium 38H-sp]|uniref:Uncharacterized protein n=1 Tax=Rarispira pelagica TaxID=3141764 RepID=A0ABU9UA50_9SPIR
MKLVAAVMLLVMGLMTSSCQTSGSSQQPKIGLAGARASSYGIRPFPSPQEWIKISKEAQERLGGRQPSLIWILGEVNMLRGKASCTLDMQPLETQSKYIKFNNRNQEEYLTAFDKAGIKVFLQVEPGDADVGELIKIVLDAYALHPSVIGFGVDVEWLSPGGTDGWGRKVSDKEAEQWEELVKSYNSEYRLFLKHWDNRWMPPTYRGDIIFVNDSQGFSTLPSMKEEFLSWAEYFYPNPVAFQIGYDADRQIWEKLGDPMQLGAKLAEKVKQELSLYWVDFTLREVIK